jgi:starch-binding outer membrane protein, SusD/RagB family
MKTTLYNILLIISITLSGCHDSLLNPIPESVLTESNYYNTSNDINLAVLGIYNRLQSRKPSDYQILEVPTDNLYLSANTLIEGTPEMDMLSVNATNPLIASFWEATYNGIFRANAVLTNIDKPTDYKEGERAQFDGEAKFMRALFYFDLVRLFGAVPNVTSILSVQEAVNIGRSPEDEIFTLIIEDLEAAVNQLPAKASIDNGRANKAAALGLLIKVYVYLQEWDKAKSELDRFFSEFGSTFGLLNNFDALWKVASENNQEVLFSLNYIDGSNGHNLSTAFLPNSGVIGIASRGNEIALPSWSLHKKYLEEDTRKKATITEWWIPPNTPNVPAIWYPYVNKYAIPHTQGQSGLDLPILRYADIVLMNAEVLSHLGQYQEGLNEINKIRERAFGNSDHNYSTTDINGEEDFLELLFLERQLEFAYENERWFDLKRSGKFQDIMAEEERLFNYSSQQPVKITLKPQAYMTLFPIPQRQIDQSTTGALTQNQGYN